METAEMSLIKVVDGQICPGTDLALALNTLKEQVDRIPRNKEGKIADASAAQEGREVVVKTQKIINSIILAAEPLRRSLNDALVELRSQRDKVVAQFQTIIDPLDRDVRDWTLAENAAAQKEEDKKNKGKRVEQRTHVVPNTPKVPGSQFRARIDFTVTDESKIKREFMSPDAVKIREKIRVGIARKIKIADIESRIGGIKVIQS